MKKIIVTYDGTIIDYIDDMSFLFFIGYLEGVSHSDIKNAIIGRHSELKFFLFESELEIKNPIEHFTEDFEIVNLKKEVIFHSKDLKQDDFKFVEYWISILEPMGFNFRGSISMFNEYLENYN